MIAREASPLPSATRAPPQSEQIEVSDLRDCVLGEIGPPEERRVLLQSLHRCSLCRGLQLRRGLESLGSLGLRELQLLGKLQSLLLRGFALLRELVSLLAAEL